MKTRQEPAIPSRRKFLETGARVAAVAAAGPLPVVSLLQAVEPPMNRASTGIQVTAFGRRASRPLSQPSPGQRDRTLFRARVLKRPPCRDRPGRRPAKYVRPMGSALA